MEMTTRALCTITFERQKAYAMLIEENICGGVTANMFEFTVALYAKELDTRKFVIDNRVLATVCSKYGKGGWKASCEQLAGGIINCFIEMMGDRLYAAACRVFNETGYVQIDWVKGQDQPEEPTPAS